MPDEIYYDILIVGAGVAGSALAHALSSITSKLRRAPIRVALLERSLAEPDRIVGEILRPAGVATLKKLGMEDALEGIDSVPERGTCIKHLGRLFYSLYPDGLQGRCFHHGRFVMRLRDYAKRAAGVDMIEATVNELIECERTKRVLGIRATRSTSPDRTKESFFADLVIMADGGFSNFRKSVLGKATRQPTTSNYSSGIILKDVQLPMPQHANLFVVEGASFVLYQISEHDTRLFINIQHPFPSNVKQYILETAITQIPESMHLGLRKALDSDRLRRMPNSYMPSVAQGGRYTKEGIFLLGDSWHMCHPAGAVGMTIALNDVFLLAQMLGKVDNFGNWGQISGVLTRWYWARKLLVTVTSLASFSLSALGLADDESLSLLLRAIQRHQEFDGKSARRFTSILAGVACSPSFLFYHVYKIAIYMIWIVFTQPRSVTDLEDKTHATHLVPTVTQYLSLIIKCVKMFWAVCIVFGPVVWSEIRWW